jgi:hypothetical protein
MELKSQNPHEKWLRLMAAEIREDGHPGWGNTAEWAADEIAKLEKRIFDLTRPPLSQRSTRTSEVRQEPK